MPLTTIKTFETPIEAHLLKVKFESEDVPCFLFDEEIVQLNPLYNVATGGVKLKVREEDIERAREILKEYEQAKLTDESGQLVSSPACSSTELYHGFKSMKGTAGIISAVVSFLCAVFPIYWKTVYKCKDCGEEF